MTTTTTAPAARPVLDAATKCGFLQYVADEGLSVTMEPVAQDMSLEDMGCVLDALDMPDHIRDEMNAVAVTNGLQTAKWDHYTVKWTRDQGNGGFMVIIVDDDLA